MSASGLACALTLGLVGPANASPSPLSGTGTAAPSQSESPAFAATPGGLPETTSAPDASAAADIADDLGIAVEIGTERTANTRTFALPDGNRRLEISAGDNYVLMSGDGDSLSDWAQIDTELVLDDGWLRPRALAGDVVVAPGGAPTNTLFAMDLTDDVRYVARWDGSVLPVAEVDGARAIYRDIYPDVDLIVEVRPLTVETYFVLKTPAAAAGISDYYLDFEIDGATAREADDGGAEFRVGDETIGGLPTPFAWDAVNDARRGTPVLEAWKPLPTAGEGIDLTGWGYPPEFVALVQDATRGNIPPTTHRMPIDLTERDGAYYPALVVDEDWLLDSQTVYPVILDPAITFKAEGDTYIRSNDANSSFASEDEMFLGTWDSGTSKYRVYAKFDTTPFKGDIKVLDADFKIYNHHSWSCSSAGWEVWSAPTWTSARTWSNHPTGTANEYIGTYTQTKGYSSSCADGWISADVDLLIEKWHNDPASEKTVYLMAEHETDNYSWKRFYSLNQSSTYKPQLVVDFNTYPAAPTSFNLEDGSSNVLTSLTAGGGYEVAAVNGQPTLSAVVADDDAEDVHAVYVIRQNGYLVGEFDGSNVSGTGVSTLLFPFALQAGVVYTVDVWSEDARGLRHHSDDPVEGTTSFNLAVDAWQDVPPICDAEITAVVENEACDGETDED